jgi:hypothetical protein
MNMTDAATWSTLDVKMRQQWQCGPLHMPLPASVSRSILLPFLQIILGLSLEQEFSHMGPRWQGCKLANGLGDFRLIVIINVQARWNQDGRWQAAVEEGKHQSGDHGQLAMNIKRSLEETEHMVMQLSTAMEEAEDSDINVRGTLAEDGNRRRSGARRRKCFLPHQMQPELSREDW